MRKQPKRPSLTTLQEGGWAPARGENALEAYSFPLSLLVPHPIRINHFFRGGGCGGPRGRGARSKDAAGRGERDEGSSGEEEVEG